MWRKSKKQWRISGLHIQVDIYLENKQQVKALMMAAKKNNLNTKFQECARGPAHVFKFPEQRLHHKGLLAMPKHDKLHSLVNESVHSLK